HKTVSDRTWTEPAVTPPQALINVSIFNFPWKFNVYASSRPYVTFEDVVETIYRTLRMNITQPEFYAAGSSNDQRRASRAYETRYRRLLNTQLYEEEKRGGMKRVDFLMERTRFASLS
ncbi:hypothetical protein BDN70DRAFT_789388, partial [Pholiota conissans]